jgi:hypothetical protein
MNNVVSNMQKGEFVGNISTAPSILTGIYKYYVQPYESCTHTTYRFELNFD